MSHFDVLSSLEEAGAVTRNRHFIYSSGRHGSEYINMDRLFPRVGLVRQICAALVEPFAGEFDVVAAPATGGIVLAVQAAASAVAAGAVAVMPETDAIAGLSTVGGGEVLAVWADKTDTGGFAFSRAGFAALLCARRVLVVEDLLSTGATARTVVREVRRHGGRPIGVSAVVSRGGVMPTDIGVPRLEFLAEVDFRATTSRDCQLCCDRVPIVENVGHGYGYRVSHRDYPGGFVRLNG